LHRRWWQQLQRRSGAAAAAADAAIAAAATTKEAEGAAAAAEEKRSTYWDAEITTFLACHWAYPCHWIREHVGSLEPTVVQRNLLSRPGGMGRVGAEKEGEEEIRREISSLCFLLYFVANFGK
jgi:hypothetical protein